MPTPLLSFAVTDFVEFILRSGDLSSGTFGGLYRAREGIEGHRLIRRARPQGYRSEVPVRWTFGPNEARWELHGRIDGLFEQDTRPVIEEIKTTREPFDLLSGDDPLHWAQAEVYGHMLALRDSLPEIDIQLTYLHLASGDVRSNRRTFGASELAAFFAPLLQTFSAWAERLVTWRGERTTSIAGLEFPFPTWRPGQKELAEAVMAAIRQERHLFAEAPTGIGKTISVLWPAIRSLADGLCDAITFLTARTTGRAIAEDTITRLRERGLRLKALTITARDRICFAEQGPCDPTTCPHAIGYYDRLAPARNDAFATDDWNRAGIESIARKHGICPFALSLDLLPWSDIAICDYNYVFDPRVALTALSGTGAAGRLVLIDEAHNLPDRARDMFSSEILDSEFAAVAADLPPTARGLRSSAVAVRRELAHAAPGQSPKTGDQVPPTLLDALEDFVDRANARLLENRPEPCRKSLLQACLSAFDFLRTAARFGPDYATLSNRDASGPRFRILCLDAGPHIRDATSRSKAAIFFSATLTPLEFFREALGGQPEDSTLRLPSPFPRAHLGLLIAAHISTEYRDRTASAEAIASLLACTAQTRPGTHIAYFPSYEYLRKVRDAFVAAYPAIPAPAQQPAMDEAAKANFLQRLLSPEPGVPTIAFAVLGGLFAEGIDLPGGNIAGICIIGVGLPQLCLERDLIRRRSEAVGRDGFAVAYAYPGFNRVLQAAGRLIRSESDAGTVVLIDRRLAREQYARLFPEHWQHAHIVSSLAEMRAAIAAFPHPA
ncbi:MAG TPA: ATP-dependent DNA helicase [Verrucomicrobiae bacterium]|nr:ATP-dependent DNA helicase [Verrucomicrobiae bacterium]